MTGPEPFSKSLSIGRLHEQFLTVVPRVERHAKVYFRDVTCFQKRADLIAECVALAWLWFIRLSRRGKDVNQFPVAFASLVARAARGGRKLAGSEKASDVMNPAAQRRHGFAVERLPLSTRASFGQLYRRAGGQREQDCIEERLADNIASPPDEQAAFRLDFSAWLRTLTGRERRVVRAMLRDERTTDLGRRFRVSPGRISQLRRKFRLGWARFCGEAAGAQRASV